MDQERHWPFMFLTLFESRWLVCPSHNFVAAITGKPELFALKSIQSPVDEFIGEGSDLVQFGSFGVGL